MAEGEENIYPSGAIPKEHRGKEMTLVKQQIKKEFGQDWLYLNEVAKPKEAELMIDLEIAARLHMTDIHKEAGVNLEKLPYVFVVPEDKWDEVCERLGQGEAKGVAGFVADEGNVVAVKENNDLLLTAETIYHEMIHAVGKVATVVLPDFYSKRQQGYRTTGKSETRGQALEEGVAEYFAREFVLNSTSDVLVRTRQEQAKKLFAKANPSEELQRGAVELKLNSKAPEDYHNSYQLVNSLVRFGGNEMWKLLLSSRIDGSKKTELIKKLNNTFSDKDTARRIFQTQFDKDDIYETRKWLIGRLEKTSG